MTTSELVWYLAWLGFLCYLLVSDVTDRRRYGGETLVSAVRKQGFVVALIVLQLVLMALKLHE